MYVTTARRLLETAAAVKADPHVTISTGMWADPQWTVEDFKRWLWYCLMAKINRNLPPRGRKGAEEYQQALACDVRTINDYDGRRIRQSGCQNILRTPEMRRRYPHVNSQPRED